MAWLTKEQLFEMGFIEFGYNVLISDNARIYNAQKIRLGNNVRIDDLCVLSAGFGGIEIGDYVHIAIFSSLQGAGKITLSSFSGLSSRVSIYSSNEDYSGAFLTNPTVPDKYKNVSHADVFIGRHAIIGSGTVILPGVTIEDGVAIGALSLVSKDCEEFWIYSGIPAKRIKKRKKDLLSIEREMIGENDP
jgi:dTDP-4-amino-4,6-dideoxy-D-glucose acyltransferase